MPKEVLLYGQIYSQSSIDFINGVNDTDEGDDLTIRINTDGGDVLYGWGMVAKFNEFKGSKKIKVDGSAYSMGAFFLLYTPKENIEALDVSDILFHRAAYPSWYESDYMTDSEKTVLSAINSSLEKAFRAKIDVPKFEAITGVTVKSMFSMDSRIDVNLTAKQAKQIGLIGSIVTITPTKKAEINATYQRIAAQYSGGNKPNTNTNPKKMTKEDFQREHPEAYAAIKQEGIVQERDRVGAWNAYAKIDADAVQAGIKSGEAMTMTVQAELNIKAAQAPKPATPETPSTPAATVAPVSTDSAPSTPVALTEIEKIKAELAPPSKTV